MQNARTCGFGGSSAQPAREGFAQHRQAAGRAFAAARDDQHAALAGSACLGDETHHGGVGRVAAAAVQVEVLVVGEMALLQALEQLVVHAGGAACVHFFGFEDFESLGAADELLQLGQGQGIVGRRRLGSPWRGRNAFAFGRDALGAHHGAQEHAAVVFFARWRTFFDHWRRARLLGGGLVGHLGFELFEAGQCRVEALVFFGVAHRVLISRAAKKSPGPRSRPIRRA